MLTIKMHYKCSSDEWYSYLNELRKQQSIVVRSAYQRLRESYKQVQLTEYANRLKGIDGLDSWWIQSGITDAKTVISSRKSESKKKNKTEEELREEEKKLKIVFGSKKNWIEYNEGKISKEEYKKRRLVKLTSIGEANAFGNRKFRLDVENNTLRFQNGIKKNEKKSFDLVFSKQKGDRLRQLYWIEEQTKLKKLPLTVKVDEEFIYLTFLPKQVSKKPKTISNRVFAIDSNPNSIGWSAIEIKDDNVKVIDTGVVDLSTLNQQKTTKIHFETFEVSKFLIDKTIHYQCSKFAVEELSVAPKDHKKGKVFNKTVNNTWQRIRLFNSLKKRCYINHIEYIEVNPAYTSIIGATLHSNYPDPISPTFEIARRAFHKYQKDKFYPKVPSVKILNEQWKQTLENSFESWVELSEWLKNSKFRYRVSLDSFKSKVLRLKSYRSAVFCRSLYV